MAKAQFEKGVVLWLGMVRVAEGERQCACMPEWGQGGSNCEFIVSRHKERVQRMRRNLIIANLFLLCDFCAGWVVIHILCMALQKMVFEGICGDFFGLVLEQCAAVCLGSKIRLRLGLEDQLLV